MVSARRHIHPVVQPPTKSIGPELLVAFAQATQQDLAHIGLAIARRVPQENYIRRRRYNDTVAPGEYPRRKVESLRKEGALLKMSILVNVFQHTHPATRRPVAIEAKGIVRHFHDPESPGRVPIERHGVEELGF